MQPDHLVLGAGDVVAERIGPFLTAAQLLLIGESKFLESVQVEL